MPQAIVTGDVEALVGRFDHELRLSALMTVESICEKCNSVGGRISEQCDLMTVICRQVVTESSTDGADRVRVETELSICWVYDKLKCTRVESVERGSIERD